MVSNGKGWDEKSQTCKRGGVKKKKSDKDRLAKFNKRLKRSLTDACCCLTRTGMPCKAVVAYTHTDGKQFCQPHKMKYFAENLAVQMDAEVVNYEIHKLAVEREVRLGTKMVDKELSIRKVDHAIVSSAKPLLQPEDEERIRLRFGEAGVITGENSDKIGLLDLEYYAPDWNDDHVYNLRMMVRRSLARVNYLYSALKDLELEKENVKLIETTGSVPMVVDGGIENGDMSQKQVRHIDYHTLRLKFLDQIDKAENTYAKALKQYEELTITALLVLKREGIVFSRDAGMMVVRNAQKEDEKPMEVYHAEIEAGMKDENDLLAGMKGDFINDAVDADW